MEPLPTGHPTPRPIPPPAPAGSALIGAAIIAACILIAYSDSLSGAFVYDDIPAIVENPTFGHWEHPLLILLPPGEAAGTVGGRPLVNLTLALNHAISGTRVWSYHVFNIIVHIAAALSLFGVVRRTLPRWSAVASPRSLNGAFPPFAPALAVALLWALHPLQTESVAYVVQRAESMMALFYLLTLYCFIRWVERRGTAAVVPRTQSTASGSSSREVATQGASGGGVGWAYLAFACCLFGMATKEVMASAPIVVFLYDRTFVAGSFGRAWRLRGRFHLALASTWILLALLIASTGGRGGTVGFEVGYGPWNYALTQCGAIVRYLGLVFWPHPLVFDYGFGYVSDPVSVAPQAALVMALVAGTVWALRRRPVLGFLGSWFFLILAPSSSVVPIVTEPVAEHRMYLPLAAIVSIVVLGAWSLWGREADNAPGVARRRSMALMGPVVAVAALFALLTFRRNEDYRTEEGLWADTVRKVPSSARAHSNLASFLIVDGKLGEAGGELAKALTIKPDYMAAHYNAGMLLAKLGRDAEAVPHFERVLTNQMHQEGARLYLGQSLMRLGRAQEAAAQFRAAALLDPGNSEAFYDLAGALLQIREPGAALAYYGRAVELSPDNGDYQFALGNALASTGSYGEAIEAFRRALKIAPDRTDVGDHLGMAYAMAGRLHEAIAEYRELLRIHPGDPRLTANLERILEMPGELPPGP